MATPTSDPTALYSDIRYTVTGAVGHIELHRPDALNAWTPGMGRELLDATRRASSDDTVRAVLVTGAGRAFCAGADVKNARELTPDGHPDLSTRLREIYNPIVAAIRAAPKPFVAGVHGACAGLGVSLALACDLVVAAEDAYLQLAFVRLGVMPDGGTTAFLAERVGLARAAELCMLGERLPAAKALDWGLVTAVHPVDEFAAAARALADRLAAGPTTALASIKQALVSAAQAALADQLDLEAGLQQRHGSTADYAEGRAAFAQKRHARFTGR
ncbi:enoyl-CoA hydratase/isomerase family protein [Actinokineospora sp.]|uniref:enoyl-CoA hydratase/isomerase family protein n=1 Tax=Actinokineospora sp. TaxID=1872133 RepID=UPI0040382C25